MGEILHCFRNAIEFTQSHRPEEVIPDPYDKCEAGFRSYSATVVAFDLVMKLSWPSFFRADNAKVTIDIIKSE